MRFMTTSEPAKSAGDRHLAQRLYLAARHHARKAQNLLGVQDHWERMDAAYHAGAAVELIAKSALATLDRRLLLTGPVLHHVVLDALAVQYGRPDVAVKERPPDKRTIDAGMAVQLAHRLIPEVREHRAAADAARIARNDASHLAQLDDAKLEDVVYGMLSYLNAAVTATEHGTADLWGGGLQAEVDRVTFARLERIEKVAKIKLISARMKYNELTETLSEETRGKLISELAERPIPSSDVDFQTDCPACELPYARLQWNADFGSVHQGDDWSEPGIALTGLLCPICNLSLDGAEVGVLGLDTSMGLDVDDLLSDHRDHRDHVSESRGDMLGEAENSPDV